MFLVMEFSGVSFNKLHTNRGIFHSSFLSFSFRRFDQKKKMPTEYPSLQSTQHKQENQNQVKLRWVTAVSFFS